MFLGGYNHSPNVDAAVFLAKEVWPRIRTELPSARLLLVGAKPPQGVADLAGGDVIVTGQVDDLRPYFDRSKVFVAAIRYGAGVKGKVTTAMSYGVPVVATSCAAEGMHLQDGSDVIIADDPADVARAVIDLYRDKVAWERMSAAAMAFVAEQNSLENGRRILKEAILRAAARHSERGLREAERVLSGFI